MMMMMMMRALWSAAATSQSVPELGGLAVKELKADYPLARFQQLDFSASMDALVRARLSSALKSGDLVKECWLVGGRLKVKVMSSPEHHVGKVRGSVLAVCIGARDKVTCSCKPTQAPAVGARHRQLPHHIAPHHKHPRTSHNARWAPPRSSTFPTTCAEQASKQTA